MRWGLSAREQRALLLGSGLAVGVVWLYLTCIVRPLMREAAELGQQVRAARDEFKTLEAATANEATLREQHRQVQETVAALREMLPAEEELPAVIEHLSDLASQSQVKIQTIFPQRPAVEKANAAEGGASPPPVYKDVLIQIDALAGYHQLGTFLSLVESGEKPMEVATLKISGDPKESKRHRIKLLVRSYFSTGGSGATGKAPAAQGAR